MEFSMNDGYMVDYKHVGGQAHTGVIYGHDIPNGSQAAVGTTVDEVIDSLKNMVYPAQIPDNVWDDLKEMIKEYGFK